MTTVFVHGVPDTVAVWTRLEAELAAAPSVALALPGFGCALPDGFTPTKDAYLGWLIRALEAVPPPRDVIAHDWGSILLLRALELRPDLVRSWVGGGAPSTADYTWHTTARLWQTPGAGEKAMERLQGALVIDMLGRAGLPADAAAETASRIDETMKRAILGLYRSSRDVFREWEPQVGAITAPGLVLWGADDPYAGPVFARRIGEVTGAEVRVLACGHWWQVEQFRAAAAAIRSFHAAAGL